MNNRIILLVLIAISMALAGCAAGSNPLISQEHTSTGYTTGQKPMEVEYATVVSVRKVILHKQPAAMAQRLGAAAGLFTGLIIGREISETPIVQGAVAGISGALASVVAKHMAARAESQEIVIKLDQSSKVVAIVQSSADGVLFSPGQKVMLIEKARIAQLN